MNEGKTENEESTETSGRYMVDCATFAEAITAITIKFQKQNPGLDFACTLTNGTKITIKRKRSR